MSGVIQSMANNVKDRNTKARLNLMAKQKTGAVPIDEKEQEYIADSKKKERYMMLWKYFQGLTTKKIMEVELRQYDAYIKDGVKVIDPKTGYPKSKELIEAERESRFMEYRKHVVALNFHRSDLLKHWDYTEEEIKKLWDKWVLGKTDENNTNI